MHNPQLHEIVRTLYQELLDGFAGKNVNSEQLIGSFPYSYFHDDNSVQRKIAEGALAPEHRQEAEKAIEAYYSDHGGGTVELYLLDLIEDFLNYVIPRTIGLADGAEEFERLYTQLDECIYGKSCHLTVFAILENVFDHAGRGIDLLPRGFRLGWYTKMPDGALSHRYGRQRAVPFHEIQKTAHPIGRGRDITQKNGYFVLEYSNKIPKNRDSIGAAYLSSYEIGRKFVFALRLAGLSMPFADYRGFRMPGHLGAHRLNCMNFPDEPLERDSPGDLDDVHYLWVGRLLPKLLQQSPPKVDLIDQKIEDAARRRRSVTLREREANLRTEIDQLLDYFQILEAVVPAEGSQYISLYAATLVKASGYAGLGMKPYEVFRFIKDMHKIRNSVLHGRIDDVLRGRLRIDHELNINAFKHLVHVLAALYVLNGDLRETATRLALGEEIKLETIFSPFPVRKPGRPRLPAMEPIYW